MLLAWLVFPGAVRGQDVTFSSTRGFYDAPFQLALSTGLVGGRVRYTTDGSVPTPTAGTLYAGPIAVATTSVVRAVAYAGAVATPVATHSYLFLNDVLRQPKTVAGWPNHAYALGAGTAIPTMSLVLNKDDFWDLYEGDASHPTSVEVFYPDGAREQFNCALGPHSTNRLKRSLALGFSTRVAT